MKYEVDWIGLWESLTKFLRIVISTSIAIPIIYHFFLMVFYNEKVFDYLPLWLIATVFLGGWIFSKLFAFFVAIWFKLASITIENNHLYGRNYWGFKNSVPLNSIKQMYPFLSNGIEAIVVDAGKHGQVYISNKTKNLSELINYLEKYLPDN